MLDSVRAKYNNQRLHAGIGCVIPLDEHEARGPTIRKARQYGLEQTARRRLAYNRDNDTIKPIQKTTMMSDPTTRSGH